MENPLKKLLEVEERRDGVYIKVAQENKRNIKINTLFEVLDDAHIVNYNPETINNVFIRARGAFERIGPQFEQYDLRFDSFINVNILPLRATIRIKSEIKLENLRLTDAIIRYGLLRKGVRSGIQKAGIKQILSEHLYDKEILIAEGIPPVDGLDAKMEMQVKIDPDLRPKIDKTGKTNYRDVESFASVKKGQLLAKRFPPKEGKPGQAVSGKPIEAKLGKDIKIPSGKNTKVSDDELNLFSLKDGVVYKEGVYICVAELLTIPGNVDFSIGNIKYTGDVFIRGNVSPGFTIETDGNIEIEGEIESAQIISKNGYITVAKGVIGKGNTNISAKKGVCVKFAQNSNITTEGTLNTEKHLLHCRCVCDRFTAERRGSSIIGGKLYAYKYIEAMNIGNETGVNTFIALIDKNKKNMLEKIKKLELFKKDISNKIQPVSRELKSKSAILSRAGSQATERQKNELKKWISSYNDLNNKIKSIDKEIADVNKKIDSPQSLDGYIKINGTIFPGVELDMYGIKTKKIHDKKTGAVFKIKEGNLQTT